MASSPRAEDEETEEEPMVSVGVFEGIDDFAEGRTVDGDDLDDSLDL
jgi:hypothetical protein